jgi:hypothetical protein
MHTIKLSFKAFVDFLHADHAGQRAVLTPFKFPDEESQAKQTYYHRAIAAIRLRHRGGYSRTGFVAEAARLRAEAARASGQWRTRCMHNARIIEAYDEYAGDAPATALSRLRGWSLHRGGVFVGVNPDLHLSVKKRAMVVKLWTLVDPPTPKQVKALTQIMHKAALSAGLKLPTSAFVVLDVARATLHRGARMGSRMAQEIDAGMDNVAALWPTLVPRPPRSHRRVA